MQPVTTLLSWFTVSGLVQGWKSATTAPCSMLCSHRCGGTYLHQSGLGTAAADQ